ncbi:helix-turn-helix domain-containing protein [Caballeronia novacaledonica]|uniref:helix-turn-helix domain-containing protein n=1 Tax=Caballeronia novacaledonica TaxID=1544861 RepID=UPI000D1199FA|nr:helix-turn-helix transcriptional regulator [Caballeronia novacaledonica]
MVKKLAKDKPLDVNRRLSAGLRAVRESAGLTLVALAESTGMSRNTLWRIENRDANARLSTIDALAKFFKLNPTQLFETVPSNTPRLPRRIALSKIVSGNIVKLRSVAGMSQEALGQAAGLARNYVSLIEVAAPDLKIETVADIARVLDVDLCILLADPRECLA